MHKMKIVPLKQIIDMKLRPDVGSIVANEQGHRCFSNFSDIIMSLFHSQPRDHPYIMSEKELGGWV